jgi:glycine dehydrogenase subunit 2
VLVKDAGKWRFDHDRPLSIGRLAGFYGNVGVYLRALAYILVNGSDGLNWVSEMAVLNANYLQERLKPLFDLPFPGLCKHEFVLSAKTLKEKYGISALDIAKGLIDRGIHPPTVYFPLIVSEAMMIEPTETENLDTLDNFIEVMSGLRKQAQAQPGKLHQAPQTTPVGRVDEVLAARKPRVNYFQDSAKPPTP